jgi:sulfur carrier protein
MITVSLNDETVSLSEGALLSTLLEQQPLDGAFAVAVNGEFVPRSLYNETSLAEGDQVDVVSPVGGG